MKIKNIYLGLMVGVLACAFTGCKDEVAPEIEEIQLGRILSVNELTARIRNQTSVELNWNTRDNATSYLVEFSEDSLEFGAIIAEKTLTVLPDELPVLVTGFAGETQYSIRVKCVAEGLEDSNWTAAVFETAPEDIFGTIPLVNIGGDIATMLWEPGSEVTHFLIVPGNVERPITDEEKAAGEATIEGLTGLTHYVVTLYNDDKRRGIREFTTLTEATVFTGGDLVAAIAAAAEGDTLVLEPGEYTINSLAITKSVMIMGQKPFDIPVIHGQLTCGTAVASVALKTLVFSGTAGAYSQFFQTVAGCNLTMLSITDCEISGYTNNFIYNNAGGTYGSIEISGSYVHDIPGGGGDGIDFRGGTIGSLTVENTTFANAFRSFLRMQASCASTFTNCTFYKVSTPDNSNNSGLFRSSGGGTLDVSKCLFVETGVANPTNIQSGNWCRNAGNMTATPTYSDNSYFNAYNMWVGLYTDPAQCDASEADPGFVDAPNGDFTVTNQDLIDEVIGDPRWLVQ